MTVENTHCVVSYDGNDVRTEFPTTFRFLDEAHLVVEVSDDDGETWTALVLGGDYEVDGAAAAEPGGTVTTADPVATGTTLRITRDTTINQLNSFRTSGSLPVATIETSFDKLTMIAQEERYRLEQLEALGDLVNVGDLANSALVGAVVHTHADFVENTFPFFVAVAGGQLASQAIWRVHLVSNPSEPFATPPAVQWRPGPGANELTIDHISGLAPGESYALNGLVFF